MKLIDLLTAIFLASGLIWALATYILIKRNILRAAMWPYVLGVGGLVFAFVSSMTSCILLRPSSDFSDYTLTNGFWSSLIGIGGYITGRMLEHHQRG